MELEIEKLIDRFSEGKMTRRQVVGSLLTLLALGGGTSKAAATAETVSPFKVTALDHIALRVRDVPRSRDFYRDLLGLRVTRDGGERSCFLSFDRGFLALFQGDEPRMDHYCYSLPGYDVDQAAETLKAADITPRVRGNRIYFDDPDGLEVQLAEDRY